jgi:hypothetical protein
MSDMQTLSGQRLERTVCSGYGTQQEFTTEVLAEGSRVDEGLNAGLLQE